MVFVNAGCRRWRSPTCAWTKQAAGYLATRHLIELGHVRIGFVCGPAR